MYIYIYIIHVISYQLYYIVCMYVSLLTMGSAKKWQILAKKLSTRHPFQVPPSQPVCPAKDEHILASLLCHATYMCGRKVRQVLVC